MMVGDGYPVGEALTEELISLISLPQEVDCRGKVKARGTLKSPCPLLRTLNRPQRRTRICSNNLLTRDHDIAPRVSQVPLHFVICALQVFRRTLRPRSPEREVIGFRFDRANRDEDFTIRIVDVVTWGSNLTDAFDQIHIATNHCRCDRNELRSLARLVSLPLHQSSFRENCFELNALPGVDILNPVSFETHPIARQPC